MNSKEIVRAIFNLEIMQRELKLYKKTEMEDRIALAEELLEGLEVGVHNLSFYDSYEECDYKIKATKKITISIIPEEFENVKDQMSPEELECVTYKPTLSVSKYKKLMDTTIIDECLMSKPATPTIAITIVKD